MTRIRTQLFISLAASAALLTGCGGGSGGGSGGGGGGGGGSEELSNLVYGTPDATYLVQVSADANEPTYLGTADSWWVEPALPAGLELDPSTGIISGTPLSESDRGSYVVTASNGSVEVTANLHLTVVLPPRFAYSAASDDTIAIYTVDAWTGALQFHATQEHDAPDSGAEQVLVHDNGEYVYVANRGLENQGSTLTAYTADSSDGSLNLVGHVPIAEGPHHMTIRPDGRFLYAVAYATHQVFAYEINQTTGALSLIDTIMTNTGPVRSEVDALGRFLFVAHGPSADITIFSIDEADGTLSLEVGGFNYYSFVPSDVDVDPLGNFVYFTFQVTNNIVAYTVDPFSGSLSRLLEAPTSGSPCAVSVHPHGGFAYVASDDTNTIDLYALDPATGQPAMLETYDAGDSPVEIEMDESGRYMYVMNADSHDISVYSINQNTGELSDLQRIRSRSTAGSVSVLRGDRPAMPEGGELFVSNRESGDLTAFSIDGETGALTRLGPNVLAGAAPNGIDVDPFGRFAFVTNADDNTLQVFEIEGGGTLIDGPLPELLGATPQGVAADPSGKYVFVTLAEPAQLVAFEVSIGSGELNEVDRISTPVDPREVSADPTGQFLYVASHAATGHEITAYQFGDGAFLNAGLSVTAPGTPCAPSFSTTGETAYVALSGSKLILPYSVDSVSGELAPLASGSAPTELRPTAVAMHPGGRFAYGAVPGTSLDSGHIALFIINPETGGLTKIGEAAAGLSPNDLVVAPDGETLYAANQDGDDVSVFSIDGFSGALEFLEQPVVGLTPESLVVTRRLD